MFEEDGKNIKLLNDSLNEALNRVSETELELETACQKIEDMIEIIKVISDGNIENLVAVWYF